MSHFFSIAVMVAVVLLLSGCGQFGSLYLPDHAAARPQSTTR